MGLTHSPRVVTDNLVSAFDVANPRSYPGSGTTWFDLVGSENGTLINGPGYSSDNGGCFTIDGTDDRISVPSSSAFEFGTGDFSLEIWHMRTTTGEGTKIMCLGDHSIGGYGAALTFSTSSGGVLAMNHRSLNRITLTQPSANVWHHYVLTRTSGTWRVYVDGVVGDNTYYSAETVGTGSDGKMRFGTNKWDGSFYYGGACRISNFRAYKGKALSAAEIKQNFDALIRRFEI